MAKSACVFCYCSMSPFPSKVISNPLFRRVLIFVRILALKLLFICSLKESLAFAEGLTSSGREEREREREREREKGSEPSFPIPSEDSNKWRVLLSVQQTHAQATDIRRKGGKLKAIQRKPPSLPKKSISVVGRNDFRVYYRVLLADLQSFEKKVYMHWISALIRKVCLFAARPPSFLRSRN